MKDNELYNSLFLPRVNQITPYFFKCSFKVQSYSLNHTCFFNAVISPYDLCRIGLSKFLNIND